MRYIGILAICFLFHGTTTLGSSSQKAEDSKDNKKCSPQIIHMSPGAEGNPCLTTEEFIRSLDLDSNQKQNWQHLVENKHLVGKNKTDASH